MPMPSVRSGPLNPLERRKGAIPGGLALIGSLADPHSGRTGCIDREPARTSCRRQTQAQLRRLQARQAGRLPGQARWSRTTMRRPGRNQRRLPRRNSSGAPLDIGITPLLGPSSFLSAQGSRPRRSAVLRDRRLRHILYFPVPVEGRRKVEDGLGSAESRFPCATGTGVFRPCPIGLGRPTPGKDALRQLRIGRFQTTVSQIVRT